MRKPTILHTSPPNLSSSSSHHTVNTLMPKLHSPNPTKLNKISFKTLCFQSPPNPSPPTNKENLSLYSILRMIPDWADGIKESRMQQKKSLYDHESWVIHRSSLRHLRHLLSSFSSRVILSLIPPVIAFTTVAAVVAAYNTAVLWHWLPEFFPVLRASSLPYQLTAPALALLLVFRTEASYSRFEEGRKAWTKIIASTSEFARQVIVSVDSSSDYALKKALLQYIMAFPVALKAFPSRYSILEGILRILYMDGAEGDQIGELMTAKKPDQFAFEPEPKCHVTYGSDIGQDLRDLLEEADLVIILNAKHQPRCIIEFISQSLQLIRLEDSKRAALDSKLSCFHEGICVCEQLMGIPIPLSYTRLTSRFLVLWHLTLPIILWDDCNWIVVPATFISAASLFCIEEVGVLIEEPFPVLALDELCNRVQDSIQESISLENLIQRQLLAKQSCSSEKHPANGKPNS